MKNVLKKKLSLLLFLLMAAVSFVEAKKPAEREVVFSVYLAPDKKKHANENFERIKDIHYAYNEIDVPLSLKESRQSMAYPYRGAARLDLYRVKMVEGNPVKVPVCHTVIPTGKQKGILVLSRTKNGDIQVASHWFRSDEMLGEAKVVNLTNKVVALKIENQKKSVVLESKKQAKISAKFRDKCDYGYIPVTGFTKEVKKNGTTYAKKVLYSNFALKRDDAHLIFILSKQNKFIQTMTLSASGVPNKAALIELQKYVPDFQKEKTAQTSLDRKLVE